MCFAVLLLSSPSVSQRSAKDRRKRYLIYPPGTGKVQLILGFGIPIMTDYESLTLGSIMKYNYQLPKNATELTSQYTVYLKRDIPAFTRWDVYSILEESISRFGIDGKACLLRSICEVSKTPLDTSPSLLVELLHIMLKPSSTEDNYNADLSSDYRSAEVLGTSGDANCQALYPECTTDLIHLITSFKPLL